MGRPEIIIVVAMTKDRVIGHTGKLPWHIPSDLQLFKQLTSGHTLIMGRKTFLSIGRPLPDRRNLVVSRTLSVTPGVEICRSFAEALRLAVSDGKKVFVIGGAEIYRQALPLASALVVSWVREDCAGDTRFPELDLSAWSVEAVEEYPEFTRVCYKKRDLSCVDEGKGRSDMPDLTLSCPHCGFARTLPAETVPDRPLRVTCPKCRKSFSYQKPAVGAPQPSEAPPWPADEVSSGGDLTPVLPVSAAAIGELRGLGQLFLDAWEIYLRRVGVLMGLYLLALLMLLVPVGLFALIGAATAALLPDLGGPLVAAGVLTGVVLGSIALFWGLAALVFAVANERIGIRAALAQGWSRLWAFAWVFSLSAFIVTGGFMLLVVPGILFSVWFFLSQFVLVDENERGMRALLKSKAYVQGKFIDVFLRLLAVWVASVLIGMVPVLGPLLSILFVPYMMIFSWLIYDDLRPKDGKIAFTCTTGEKAVWLGIGALGFLIVPVTLLVLLLGWLGQSLSGFIQPWHWFGF